MKRWGFEKLFIAVILGFLAVFVVYPGNVSAQTYQCDDAQTILKLWSQGNSHAEAWDGANDYQTEICFNELFGSDYTGDDPHACIGDVDRPDNLILRLGDTTNAHAERPEEHNYDIDVCFGNLVCRSLSSDDGDCSVFGDNSHEVLALSEATNAHLEARDTDTYDDNTTHIGGYRVCCGVGGLENIIVNAEWRNPVGSREINETFVNRSVKLFSETTFPENTDIEFAIWEDDPLSDDPILTTIVQTDFLGNAIYDWFIDDAVIELADDFGDCNAGDGLEFFFEALEDDSPVTSGLLLVHCEEGPNLPPVATISEPIHRQMYFVDTNIEFNQTSVDPEFQPITYEWVIEFNNEVEFTSSEDSFMLNFTQPGERTITLRVTDDVGQWGEDQIAILIVESGNIFTYINKPFHREIVQAVGEPVRADFSATDTYVVNVSGACPDTIIAGCLAGNCPGQTRNAPDACVVQNVTTVAVSDAPNSTEDADFSEIFFEWTFGQDSEEIRSFGGLNNVSGWQSYSIPSHERDDKWITLRASYDEEIAVSEETDRIFTLGQCVDNGNVFLETDGLGNFVAEHDTSGSAWCGGADGLNGTADDCCPIGFSCNLDPGVGPIGCIGSPDNVNECSDYANQQSCETDQYGVGTGQNPVYEPLVEACQEDGGAADITCVWNSTISECVVELDCQQDHDTCSGSSCGTNACTDYICTYNYPQTECQDGYLTINYQVLEFSPGTCPGSSGDISVCERAPVTVPCGRLNFDLNFFDWAQFMIAATLIVAIYLIMGVRSSQRRSQKVPVSRTD